MQINSSYYGAKPAFINPKLPAKASFSGEKKHAGNDDFDPDNPINRFGEYCLGIQKSFYDSLKAGGRAFGQTAYYSALSGDDIGDSLKFSAIVGCVVAIGAFIIEFPRNLYNANVNFFAKKHQANVDLASYKTEKVIFDQIGKKAETAETAEEREKLHEQLVKMEMAKKGLTDYKNFSPFNA